MRTHRYLAIAEDIRGEITSSGAQAGDVIGSEAQYVARFGVSRITVRRALEVLRDEGWIAPRQGFGWVVVRPSVRQSLGALTTIESEMRKAGVKVRRRIVSARAVSPTGRVREILGAEPVREVKRVNLADEVPFAVVTVWLAESLARDLTTEVLEDISFYEALEQSGRLSAPLVRAVQTIASVALDAADAALLEVAAGSPGLSCERVTYGADGLPVLFSHFVFPGARTVFEVELNAPRTEGGAEGIRLLGDH